MSNYRTLLFTALLCFSAQSFQIFPAFAADIENVDQSEEVTADTPEDEKSAEDTLDVEEILTQEQIEAAKERQKAADKAFEKMAALTDTIDDKEQEHFAIMYNSYNMIETVKIVRENVKNTIDECIKNNTEMENTLQNRYSTWNEAIDSEMEEAEAQFQNMIIAQDYASEKDLKEIFAAIDDTRKKTYSQIDRIPVTTPEGCEYLRNKMDETQQDLVYLLRQTLVAYPRSTMDTFPTMSEQETSNIETDIEAPEENEIPSETTSETTE